MTREAEVTGAIVAQDKQLVEANNRLQEVSVIDLARGADETAQEKAEERAALNACRKVLEGLLSKTQERTGISVTNIRMSEGGRVALGLVNIQDKYANSADNIEATSGGSTKVNS